MVLNLRSCSLIAINTQWVYLALLLYVATKKIAVCGGSSSAHTNINGVKRKNPKANGHATKGCRRARRLVIQDVQKFRKKHGRPRIRRRTKNLNNFEGMTSRIISINDSVQDRSEEFHSDVIISYLNYLILRPE